MKAKKTDAAKIAAIAARHSTEGWTFRGDYSGRGMFGRRCPGIVCPQSDIELVETAVRRARVKGAASGDQLGRDAIVYWPSVASDLVLTH